MNRDDIIRMAREAGCRGLATRDFIDLERFAALVAAAEREACAKLFEPAICEAHRVCAKAIRARGQA